MPSEQITVHPAFLASQVEAGTPPSGFDAVRARRFPLVAMAHHPSKIYGRALMFEALAFFLKGFELLVQATGLVV